MSEVVLYSILLLITAWMVEKLLQIYWLKPMKIRKLFMDQGIRGPPYVPFIGSLGELGKIYAKAGAAQLSSPSTETNQTTPLNSTVHLAFPHLPIWRENYGKVFLYWYGRVPRLSISDPELIKEFTSTPRKYYQSIQHPLVYNLIGKSILASGGESWVTQRRLVNPLFNVESLRGLSGLVVNTVEKKINLWKSLMTSDELELDLYKEFEDLSQDIIANVMFGNDREEGLQIAKLHSEQAAISSKLMKTFYIPGTRFIPTPVSQRSKWLRREAEKRFHGLIERRLRDARQEEDNDWVSQMLSSGKMSKHEIIDECCSIFIAGSESTNILMAWVCIHLGLDKTWQEKARDEIKQVLLNENLPIIKVLNHLKILNMIINETLRLYPSVPYIMKHSQEETKLGELRIPAGIDVEVPIMSVHHDPTTWGDNASEFDPSRFSEGVSKAANHPMAFMPFMLGPRVCPGMNFAMIEAKVTLAVILQNFDVTTSPKYKHLPVGGITLRLGSGAPVIIKKI